ncbi:tRNA (adenosine(37)-N6)-threonylcarbamoyltransferase complex ATPase subunit type 1 TsaE [Sphingomonas sinipercae]|uniref:tRNA threonylcarbamoyladenosine biosynthesis protein TsaE n=1 Tax=Sphingomonas sinipercae TaxID=2714944 RepID=A0A6G7ZP07_9SPHN|nr:tRNA (adenosine(37)-N6)-threonylcarbamoyltransferase complex ATPase subunit type 1 TsaE [Sphingomonas sinipercae]QIL02636.1 tRNA (adenosine(37)-N6)-threonylcarbamoyltransferase complex ATPase subunit type 1 TsaE [Sphingomonas sinipercae]
MIIKDEAAASSLGSDLAKALRAGDVITLSGPLGVGKTTLARGILSGLGHKGDMPSPTFALVQPYDDLKPPVWHVDLYRLEDPSELEELGLDVRDTALIVEWPERAGAASWPQALRLSLEFAEAGARRLTAKVPPSWQGRWPPQ